MPTERWNADPPVTPSYLKGTLLHISLIKDSANHKETYTNLPWLQKFYMNSFFFSWAGRLHMPLIPPCRVFCIGLPTAPGGWSLSLLELLKAAPQVGMTWSGCFILVLEQLVLFRSWVVQSLKTTLHFLSTSRQPALLSFLLGFSSHSPFTESKFPLGC